MLQEEPEGEGISHPRFNGLNYCRLGWGHPLDRTQIGWGESGGQSSHVSQDAPGLGSQVVQGSKLQAFSGDH
jgi:hypothetical protein